MAPPPPPPLLGDRDPRDDPDDPDRDGVTVGGILSGPRGPLLGVAPPINASSLSVNPILVLLSES